MKKNALVLVTLTLLASIAGLSQTRSDLKQKYGSPDDSGRYIVRPGIGMTVRVDEAGVIRDMTIRPIESAASSASPSSTNNSTMQPELVKAIVDEVVPLSKRGKYKGTGSAEFGCTSIDHSEYENVIVSMTKRCDQQGGGTYTARVHWTN